MQNFLSYRLRYSGTNFYNFINKLIKQDIYIFNVCKLDSKNIIFSISSKYYSQLNKISDCDKLVIEKEGGIKFLLKLLLKRIGLFIGLIAILFSSFMISKKTLYIKIIGVEDINALENAVYKYGIKRGTINNVDNLKLEKYLLEKIENLSLVSVKNKGNALIINAIEKQVESIEFQPFYSPYNMIVNEIKLLSGTLCVEKNSVVKKGDILVDSFFINSNGEKINVEAKANIIADVWFCGSETEYKQKNIYVKTGNQKTKSLVCFNNKKHDFVSPYNTYVTENIDISVTNNKFLPINLSKTIFYETKQKVEIFDFEKNKIRCFEKSKEKAYDILPSNVIINEEIQRLSDLKDKYIFQTYLKATMEITNEN